ncbi:MAG TPA: class I SAM-dependent methyltransferase [Burkholderiales bacterium]
MSDNEIVWKEKGAERRARWHSEAGVPPPRRVVIADDTLTADRAYRLACEGTAMLWRGDFQNARLLLQALGRRVDGKKEKPGAPPKADGKSQAEKFHLYRMGQAQRARTLGMLLIPFDADHTVPLRRAPDVTAACTEAYGAVETPYVASLRELIGLIGAHEWRRRGLPVEALGADKSGAPNRIHAHYGVFAPVRGEYLELVWRAPLPKMDLAFDIGTGTVVLAAILARRGVKRVVATELDARALTCARDNLRRLKIDERIEVVEADLFPPIEMGQADLIICNPPWLPGKPGAPLERAIYDQDSRMLKGFLGGLAARLAPRGEGWLILSDLAEHLGLRTREELLGWIAEAGLKEVGRLEARPQHPKSNDENDPLHAARKREVTSLWRLAAA